MIYGCLFIYSCSNPELEKQALIDSEVGIKLDGYKTTRMDKCKSDIMRKVIEDADSIMLKMAFRDFPDSLHVPEKRNRPEAPMDDLPEFETPKAPQVIPDSTK